MAGSGQSGYITRETTITKQDARSEREIKRGVLAFVNDVPWSCPRGMPERPSSMTTPRSRPSANAENHDDTADLCHGCESNSLLQLTVVSTLSGEEGPPVRRESIAPVLIARLDTS